MTTATLNAVNEREQQTSADFGNELRQTVIGVELMKSTVGRSRMLAHRQSDEVADHFGADREQVGGSKRLYAPRQREIKQISSVLSEATALWKRMTYFYKKGVRLLPKARLADWNAQFAKLQERLEEALVEADAHYDDILAAAREKLGPQLFEINDYPKTFVGSVSMSWASHNFEPSDELLRLSPETYQREQQRVRAQFDAAVAAFEEESRTQLAKLVESLLSKLRAANKGEDVKYTEAATTNLREFFDRFSQLNIRSDAALTELVGEAKEALSDTTMKDLKDSKRGREQVAKAFENVSAQLSAMIVAAPTRSIDMESLE